MAHLGTINAVRTNGSSTATEASAASNELTEYMRRLVSFMVLGLGFYPKTLKQPTRSNLTSL
jgi:hypothetical protein